VTVFNLADVAYVLAHQPTLASDPGPWTLTLALTLNLAPGPDPW